MYIYVACWFCEMVNIISVFVLRGHDGMNGGLLVVLYNIYVKNDSDGGYDKPYNIMLKQQWIKKEK